MSRRLEGLLEASATRHPDRTAVVDPSTGRSVSYAEFAALSAGVAEALRAAGVGPGDRVGVSGKSIATLAAIFGAMRAGAAYVPVDVSAPAARSAAILADCAVRAVVAPRELSAKLAAELGIPDEPRDPLPALAGLGPELVLTAGPGAGAPADLGGEDRNLAYVLYTSGSTGKPKGVMHTHASALAFVDWCAEAFRPTPEDRFSSHAPFHFDLSILDIYVPLMHGSTLVLIPDELGKQPTGLAALIAEERISVWYSTPSILTLLVEFGRLERYEFPALRIVNFAGEVFPVGNLRRLQASWSHPRYLNLYGPTETNVCTFCEVPGRVPDERSDPYPIGVPCSGDRCRVVDGTTDVARGEEGELVVAGGSVMVGYWNDPAKTDAVFFEQHGDRWYRTGDVVREDESGAYVFLGRRDRMIKRRGYRIEPGEIEAALHRHPEVVEAAVLGRTDAAGKVVITAHLACRTEPLSVIALKRWCSENLPLYMIPDRFSFHDALPKTSTDKVDYQMLKGLA